MNKNYCSCGCGKEIGIKSKWAKGHNPNKAKDRFDWSNVERDYKELGTLELVAEKYGCTHNAVHNQLRKRGIETPLIKTDWSNILEDYNELKSVKKIAKKYNRADTTVADRLKALDGFRFSHDNKSLNVEVGIGRYGERIGLNLLKGSKDMNKVSLKFPYDIEWNGLKIDVKTSRQRLRRSEVYYSFSAKNHDCTHYLLIALDDNDFPVKILLIPREEVKGVSITFKHGAKTKWDQYKMEVQINELRESVHNAKRVG